MPVILAVWEAEIWQSAVRGPISKITRAKWTGDVAQVVKCLLCKYEAINSNPGTTKKKKRVRKE
jgi:hypothetical protein